MAHHVHVHVHIGNKSGASAGGGGGGRRGRRRRAVGGSRRRTGARRRYKTTTGSRPGSGSNFRALSNKLGKRGARNPGGLAAYIGRKKYGNAGMARMAAAGRRRSGGRRGRRRG